MFEASVQQLLLEFLRHQEELQKCSTASPGYAEQMAEYAECVELLIAHKSFSGLYFEPLEKLIAANPKLKELETEYDMANRHPPPSNL